MELSIKEWAEVLLSGKYEQGRGFLRYEDRFCCLGVHYEESYGLFYDEHQEVGAWVTREDHGGEDGFWQPSYINYDKAHGLALLNDGGIQDTEPESEEAEKMYEKTFGKGWDGHPCTFEEIAKILLCLEEESVTL